MKKLLLLAATLLSTVYSFGQTTNMVWANNLKYSSSYPYSASYPSDIALDNSGNYYVTGDFEGVLDMDPGAGTYTLSSKGGDDAFIAKYTTNGNLLWAKSFGTTGPDGGNALQVVNNKLYVVGGFWDATMDIDPSATTYTIGGSGGGIQSGFVATFDTSGTLQSAFAIAQCPVIDVKTDNSSNFYLAGKFLGSVDLDPGPGVFNKSSVAGSSGSTWDMYYGKYTASGNLLWVNTKGTSQDESTNGISIDPVTSNVAVAASNNGIYAALCSSAGTIIKEANMGTGLASDVCFDNNGDFYFSGIYSFVVDLDWSATATYSLANASTAQAFVMKYNSNNTFSWAKQISLISSINYATGPVMNLDNNNDILLTNRESNAGSASWLVFMKTDHNTGSVVWRNNLTSVCYNGNNGNEGTGIIYNPADQTVLVTGMIGGSSNGGSSPCQFDADPGSGVYNLSAGTIGVSNFDIFMGKYGSCAGVPINLSAISGSTTQCSGATTLYSVSPVSGASSYTWSLPGGWTGTSTTNTISATASSSGTITVGASNACGSSTLQTLTVQVNPVPVQPAAISGAMSLCSGVSAQTYSVPVVSGASSYSWSLPGGWTGASSSNTIQVNPNATGGVISVAAINGCGNGPVRNLNITVNALPSVSITGVNTVCAGSSISLNASGATTYTWSTSSNNNSISVSPSANTTYTVTGTDANGCENTATKNITVNTLPLVAISGPSVVCAGELVTLNATGANTYTWSNSSNNNSISEFLTSDASYTVTGTDGNGCENNAIHHITVNPLPSVIISGNTTICMGTPTTLTVTGATSYTWSTSASGNTVSVSPTSNTTYSVSGVDANGCSGSAFANVTVSPSLAISVNGPSFICTGNSAILSATGATSYTWSTSANTSSITVSPLAFTIYTVSGTDANGCSGTTYKNITVIALPSVTISGPTVVCTGSSINLNAAGANTYTWNTGSNNNIISVNPVTNTTYTVTGTDDNGCQNTASTGITVNALPSVSISATQTLICVGESITLNASGADTYTWSTGNSGVSESVSPTGNSTYTLNGTDVNSCDNIATITVSVSLCTGINTINSINNQVMLYPNPTNRYLVIQSASIIHSIEIIDVLGNSIYTAEYINDSTQALDLEMSQGIYFAIVKTKDQVQKIKFIKQ